MRHLFVALAVLIALPTAHAADPRVGLHPAYGTMPHSFVESIAPPVVERGKTTLVTFVGHGFGPGLDVWHSLPAGNLKAVPVESTTDRLVFDVTVAADAPVGVCGVRAATRDGLTNACLLMVEDLPVVAKPRAAPFAVWGTFREATLDRYRIEVKAGERVSFEVVSNRFGKDADPLVTIRDASGRWVAEHDNDPGLYFDARFEHRFEAAGTYTVEVRDARFKSSEHHHYVLRVGRFPAGRVAVPAAVESGFWGDIRLPEVPEASFSVGVPRSPGSSFFATVKRPGDQGSAWVPLESATGPVTVADEFDEARDAGLSQAASGPAALGFWMAPTRLNPFLPLDRTLTFGRLQATPAAVPGTLCGVLRKPGRVDTFKLHLEKNQRIFVRGEAKALNSPADLELAIVDRSGRELRRAGENTQTREEASFDFTAPAAGEYGLVARDALRDGGDAFAYRVAVRTSPFPPRITADVEGLTIPQGSYQPIPIILARNNTSGPIKLYLTGGPPGLRLVPSEIGDKETAVVCRLEADGSAPVGVHAVQIVAETDGPNGVEHTLVQTQPLIDRKFVNIDLVPVALREDQTRLPPSLADRFAVQVTPPAPFAFELAEKEIILPRYQKAAIPVVTTRAAGFDGPIMFEARGGQLAEKAEGRTRVYAEFSDATVRQPNPSGAIVSKILSNTGRVRTEVSATGVHQGRRVTLTRAFDLDLTTAFRFAPEPAKVSLLPGESAKVRLSVSRLKTFDGPVTLHLPPVQDVAFPETVTVPKGQTGVDIDIAVSPAAQPRKQGLSVLATGDVDGFEEEVRGSPVEIEVRKK